MVPNEHLQALEKQILTLLGAFLGLFLFLGILWLSFSFGAALVVAALLDAVISLTKRPRSDQQRRTIAARTSQSKTSKR